MKWFCCLLLITFFCFKHEANAKHKNYKVFAVNSDSMFMGKYYFMVLDSIAHKRSWDTSSLCVRAIKFMERRTGISAHPDCNFAVTTLFQVRDLLAWREWFDKNGISTSSWGYEVKRSFSGTFGKTFVKPVQYKAPGSW